jgi:paraquat-inducible protein B
MPDTRHQISPSPRAIVRLGRRIVCAGVLLAGALGLFWWKANLATQCRLVLFFPNSVNGIPLGAPVKVNGVTVGQVSSFGVRVPNGTTADGFYAAVWIVLDDTVARDKGFPEGLSSPGVLGREIARGLRGKRALRSPLTGDFYIELAYVPSTPPVRVSAPDEALPEIPVIPVALSIHQFDALVGQLQKFSEFDFPSLGREWERVLETALRETAPQGFHSLNGEILEALDAAREVLDSPSFREDIRRLHTTLVEFRAALERDGAKLGRVVSEGAVFLGEIQQTLARVRERMASVAVVLDLSRSEPLQKLCRHLRQIRVICEKADAFRRQLKAGAGKPLTPY